MNYQQALAWLYSTQQHGIKLGLENMRSLARQFPQSCRRMIHVAGTNGKGSVCAMIDSVARAQGVTCGLYTSPHLVNFRERIKINGDQVSENDVLDGLIRIRDFVSTAELKPTFFEITTALALYCFAKQPLDLLVLETGMGGRLDATNALQSSVSVITPIGLDHREWLGDTLEKIATEKAGIIKPGVPVFSSPQPPEVRRILEETSRTKETSVVFVEDPLNGSAINLPGSHQRLNATLALAALKRAGFQVSKDALCAGLSQISWPGRFQVIDNRFVLDGAHNPHAASRLACTWKEYFGEKRATIVLGVLSDKDQEGICRALIPIAERFYVVPVNSPRSGDPATLVNTLRCFGVSASAIGDLPSTIRSACVHQETLLITGSLFLVGEALRLLRPEYGPSEVSAQ